MTTEPSAPPTRQAILRQTAVAAGIAAAALVLVALPAEYGIDPTGFGKLTGLTKLAAPQRAVVDEKAVAAAAAVNHNAAAPFRENVLEIKLGPDEDVERKVWMEKGQTLVYSWTADREVYSDFHGETLPQPKVSVSEYRVTDPLKGADPKTASGALSAPMTGFHGWYFLNLEDKPVIVRVKLAGYYDLRPYVPPS